MRAWSGDPLPLADEEGARSDAASPAGARSEGSSDARITDTAAAEGIERQRAAT